MCEKLINNINSIRHNLSCLPQNMLIDHSEKVIKTMHFNYKFVLRHNVIFLPVALL